MNSMRCFRCDQPGHMANQCPNKPAGYAAPTTQQGGGGQPQALPQYVSTGYKGDDTFDYREADQMLFPISMLTEVHGMRWFIKARVVDKSEVRAWSNARGNGTLASVTLIDSSNVAIRATFFKKGVDKYYDMLVPNEVFYFGNGRIKPAQKKFSSLPHDYEISFDENGIVQPVRRDDGGATCIPTQVALTFTELKDIENMEGRNIDLKCVVREVGPATTIRRKSDNTDLTKRTLKVCDNTSPLSYDLTIWGQTAENFTGTPGNTLVVKACRIGKFMNAINLNGSNIEIESPAAADLRDWWDRDGCRANFQNVAADASAMPRRHYNRIGLDQIEHRGLGRGDKPDVMYIRGTITGISDKSLTYLACQVPRDPQQPDVKCNKKVEVDPPTNPDDKSLATSGRCPEHGTVSNVAYRYIASMKVGDLTNNVFVTAFDQVAQPLFGVEASEVANVDANIDTFNKIKRDCEWQPCLMTVRVKEDTVPGQPPRMKHVALNVRCLRSVDDFVAETDALLKDIDRYQSQSA